MMFNVRLMLIGGLAGSTLGYIGPLQESSAAGNATSSDESGRNPIGTLQATWTFEDGTAEDASEFPTDGTRPSLAQNPSANLDEMEVSSEQAAVGSKSLKIFLDGQNSSIEYRNQIKVRIKPHPTLPQAHTAGMAELGEYWLGYAVYLPASHTRSLEYEIIMQSHWRRLGVESGDRNPMLTVNSNEGIGNGGRFYTVGRYLDGYQEGKDQNHRAFRIYCAPIVSGWTEVVQHVIWDYRSGGTGRYEIWMRNSATNGWQQYVDYSGPLGPNDGAESAGSFDLGLYKGWRSDRADNDLVTTRLIYIDEIRYALDDGNFALVAPREFTKRPAAPTLLSIN